MNNETRALKGKKAVVIDYYRFVLTQSVFVSLVSAICLVFIYSFHTLPVFLLRNSVLFSFPRFSSPLFSPLLASPLFSFLLFSPLPSAFIPLPPLSIPSTAFRPFKALASFFLYFIYYLLLFFPFFLIFFLIFFLSDPKISFIF